jgi:homoserine dehydrogenase
VVHVGLLGCGVVGSAVARAIERGTTDQRGPNGTSPPPRFEVTQVAVRDPAKRRDCSIPRHRFVTDPVKVAGDPGIDVVVEVMGGVEPAFDAITVALGSGKPVVTANKELLGTWGSELAEHSARGGVPLLYEAAVAGTVPIVRLLSDHLASDRIERIEGVLNGTSNFVLEQMELGLDADEALQRARDLGYAEADASRDLDGTDAADKLAILARIAFGEPVSTDDVHTLGIRSLSAPDLRDAVERGTRWRLLATAGRGGCLRVEPVPLPADHPLAALRGPESGVLVTAERAGTLLLRGAGAGGDPTAVSVMADLAVVLRCS